MRRKRRKLSGINIEKTRRGMIAGGRRAGGRGGTERKVWEDESRRRRGKG